MEHLGVFNGRLSPPTDAHLKGIIIPALDTHCDRVITNLGSCYSPRTLRTPFTGKEIETMIRLCLSDDHNSRLTINQIPDFLYNDNEWVRTVQASAKVNVKPNTKISLIGHSKDNTSYYLKLFPFWSSINFPNYNGINATDARNLIFSDKPFSSYKDKLATFLYPQVIDYIETWMQNSPNYQTLLEEQEFVIKYREKYGEGPFLTGDGVVFQSGCVLMIRRKNMPGRGLLALPGGFLEKGETLLECATRETYEETRLDMPMGAFAAAFKVGHNFDIPYRDPRARIITFAAAFDISHEMERKARNHAIGTPLLNTKVKAADDAAEAIWIPLSELNSEEVFADHYHIIMKMAALIEGTKTM